MYYIHCRLLIADRVFTFDGPRSQFGDWIIAVLTDTIDVHHYGVRIDLFSVEAFTK